MPHISPMRECPTSPLFPTPKHHFGLHPPITVIPNGVCGVRYAFPSPVFCAMNPSSPGAPGTACVPGPWAPLLCAPVTQSLLTVLLDSSPPQTLRPSQLCHPDRRPASFAGRSGGITAQSLALERLSSLLSSLIDWLSSRLRPQEGAQRPHFLFRAALWHVGPRSAFCAPRALRRGGGICFFLPSLRTSASSAPLRYPLLALCSPCPLW